MSKKPIGKISFGGEKLNLGRLDLDFVIESIVVEVKFNISVTLARLWDCCIVVEVKFDIGAALARLQQDLCIVVEAKFDIGPNWVGFRNHEGTNFMNYSTNICAMS